MRNYISDIKQKGKHMNRDSKILVIGAGGIGSWLVSILHKYDEHGQMHNAKITIADPDIVEDKNLSYQNFEEDEILDYKSLCLESRYNVNGINHKINTHDQLATYDLIVCCVDNGKTRKMLFEYCTNNDTYFIDLRCEGHGVYALTSDADKNLDQLLDTVDDSEEGSCQLAHELNDNIIQLGNRIIASIGAQMTLNWIRGELNVGTFTHRF